METSNRAMVLAQELVGTLPAGVAGLFNPWKDVCEDDEPWNGPQEKLERLAAHLDCEPQLILCGEAPGHLGCRHSGVAFTSERLLMEGSIPRIAALDRRITCRDLPFSEPSATIVWRTLYRLGLAEKVVMWNALQLHPHKVDDHRSNRTPTGAEISLGAPALKLLVSAFPAARVVAVGRKAEGLLSEMGVKTVATVRHPANGGATAFAEGMAALAL